MEAFRPCLSSQRALASALAAFGLLAVACAAREHAASVAVEASVTPSLRTSSEPLPLLTLEGKSTDLRELAGQVTVVVAWSTTCGPCVEKLPTLEALRHKLEADPRVRMVVVSVDSPRRQVRARALLAEHAPTLSAYFDPSGKTWEWLEPTDGRGYKVQILPLIAIIDAEGQVHRRIDMERDRSGVSFEEVVEGALAGQMAPSLPNIFAQRNPSLPPARPGMVVTIARDATPEQIDRTIRFVERVYRQDPEFTDRIVEERLQALRLSIEEGVVLLEPDFSKPAGDE